MPNNAQYIRTKILLISAQKTALRIGQLKRIIPYRIWLSWHLYKRFQIHFSCLMQVMLVKFQLIDCLILNDLNMPLLLSCHQYQRIKMLHFFPILSIEERYTRSNVLFSCLIEPVSMLSYSPHFPRIGQLWICPGNIVSFLWIKKFCSTKWVS